MKLRAFLTGPVLTGIMPVALYCLVGFALMLQGVRYLLATEIMPYHLAVIGGSWAGLDSASQTLLLGLLQGFGAGSFCVGLALMLLALIPLRAGSRWARWATAAVALTYNAMLVYVTSSALLPGAVPVTVTITLLLLVAVAFVSSWFREDAGR